MIRAAAPERTRQNQVALRSARPRYPAAKPPPATSTHPPPHGQDRRNHPSSTRTPQMGQRQFRSGDRPLQYRPGDPTEQGVHRGLGDPVHVDHPRRPGWRCIHAESRLKLQRLPTKDHRLPTQLLTHPPDTTHRRSAGASKADGVCESIPTRSPTSSACSSSGERTTESATITSRPPWSSGPQIPPTPNGRTPTNDTASTPWPTPPRHPTSPTTALRCESPPFGVPVVPRCK